MEVESINEVVPDLFELFDFELDENLNEPISLNAIDLM